MNEGPRGPRGKQGKRGEHGTEGLSRPVRRALVFLFTLSVALAAANMLWTAYLVREANQARCAAVVADATIPLPREAAAREWDAAFEAIARERARQLHCPGT